MADSRLAFRETATRSRLVAIGLAAGLLALPLTAAPDPVFGGLSFAAIVACVLPGVSLGWGVADRLAAKRIPAVAIVGVIAAAAIVIWVGSRQVVFHDSGSGRAGITLFVAGMAGGLLVRGTAPDRRSLASLVAIAAMTVWLTYDLARLPFNPLRDLHLYVNAAKATGAGASPYLRAPLEVLPDPNHQPFVYPPPTIPLFRLIGELPVRVEEGIWIVAMLAAAVGALWLLGVRGRWLVAVLAWPPIAVGIAVGNVAIFLFFLLAAGFWAGALLVVGGLLKPQAAILALWLVRHRRWRAIAIGGGIVVALILVTLPFTGLQSWFDWAASLGHFQATTDRFRPMKGLALNRSLPVEIAAVAGLVAVGLAFLGRGRNGLARFGVASVVVSPTLYLHGLTALLPGALALRPTTLWFVLGLGPWIGAGSSTWLAVLIVAASLLIPGPDDLPIPADLSASEADVHPAGRARRVWPERGEAPSASVLRRIAVRAPRPSVRPSRGQPIDDR